MRTHKRLLISLAALAAAGLAGCLNSPDSTASLNAPVTESEIQAALSGDSAHPAPVRPAVCDTLKARLGSMDSTSPGYAGFSVAVVRVCLVRPVRPDSLRPWPPRPDSLRPKPDTARPNFVHPLPPFCDSLKARLAGLDTASAQFRTLQLHVLRTCKIRPVRPFAPDTTRTKPPRPDSAK